jgi:hypothetical protein
MPNPIRRSFAIAIALLALGVMPAEAGDCTGRVVGVRPLSQYDHDEGRGFLAVRTGPSTRYRQVGELYRGDKVAIWDRQGNWYEVACMSGHCTWPEWGRPRPHGWAYAGYIRARGDCP